MLDDGPDDIEAQAQVRGGVLLLAVADHRVEDLFLHLFGDGGAAVGNRDLDYLSP